ncbi:SET and MYND domain-containing protein 4 isoform X2 [Danaus plexippus]|uniref:SET and MYND domain-containing protein 4 isoform X2 n=1 Tax=Danaus plexippus TaxID=13037 RepID=UPI002AB2995C|nr:SET and MYND domain-containing protein 4 isoform X2 [Danaus plexippus]
MCGWKRSHVVFRINKFLKMDQNGVDFSYATMCSDVTLCANNKGFFKNFAEEMVSLAEIDGWLDDFELIEDKEKVLAVRNNQKIMEPINELLSRIQPLFRGKDARVSHEKKTAAVIALKNGDLVKSLSLANQAVLRAPMTGTDEIIDSGITLALSLWVRSEVLLSLNRPKPALEDLKLALKERLPARMRADYYWRMGHCYKGTGETTRAKVSYELASRLLGDKKEAKIQLANDIESLKHSTQSESPSKLKEPQLTSGATLNLPALSKLLKITEDNEKGRYAVANAPVKTGDIVLVESPYAACLLADCHGSHCLHCFVRLEDFEDSAPIWCPNCSGVAFCSIQCRDAAISTYHLYECPFFNLFIGSGMSVLSHIALRMVTQAGLDTSLSIHSKFLSNEVKTIQSPVLNDVEGEKKKFKIKSRKERLNRTRKGMNIIENKTSDTQEIEPQIKNETSYNEKIEMAAEQIYSLLAHSRQRKGADYLKRIIMGMFLTECLKKTDFFKNCEKENITRAEISICELIVRNLQLLQFNAHEIYETVRGEHQFRGSKPVYIGVGIYPTGALFNHECYPAVARYFYGKKMSYRAIRPLEPGEIAAENYGPHFLMRTLKERQRMLTCRYWFRCQCIACVEDWPTLKETESKSPIYLRCLNKKCHGKIKVIKNPTNLKCPKCSMAFNKTSLKECLNEVDIVLSQYEAGAKLMEQQRPQDAIEIFSKAIDCFYDFAMPPHRETHIAQESLRSCYATFGNTHILKEK